MKIKLFTKFFLLQGMITIFFLLLSQFSFAQVDLTLTLTDFLNWQPTVATQANISNVPLHNRKVSPNAQILPGLDTNTRILYSPDGMDNFGPYIDSASQFNLFNFSHWQSIDILAWFGGSAGTPVIIPSKPWVDAAHANGVKVIGTVFMAPTVFGGSQAIMQNFLQQDSAGNYAAITQLMALANYYHFDGWIMNFETPVNSATGALAADFMNDFDSIYNGELIWYDALLPGGNVSYQNRLNATNGYFFEHATGMFTNYNWSSATVVASSNTYATGLGRSPFDVYTGADMWPNRPAQPAFTNYTWVDKIITNNVAKTSIALFATNFTFNYGGFSNFNNDFADYANFYGAERKIFSGLDEDPAVVDNTWKGFCNYIPVKTTITSFPFQTDFNTGHGLNYYYNGAILNAGQWHNMSHQSVLPSWTFSYNGTVIDYNFADAYQGGSSLNISASAAGSYSIPLYSTCLVPGVNTLMAELVLKSSSQNLDSVGLEIMRSNGASPALAVFHPGLTGSWEDLNNYTIPAGLTDTLTGIKLNIYASGSFTLNVGKIRLDENLSSTVNNIHPQQNSLTVFPNPSNGLVNCISSANETGQLIIFDLQGHCILTQSIEKGKTKQLTLPGNGLYMYEYTSGRDFKRGKLVVNK